MKRQYEYFLIAILIPVVLGTAGLFYYLKNEIQQKHLKEVMDGHYSDTQFLKTIFEDFLSRYERDLFSLEKIVVNVKDRNELKRLFLDFHKINNNYDQVRFIDSTGHEIVRTDKWKDQIVINETLQNKSDMDYFIKTMKLKSGEVYLSPITFNREFHRIEAPPREMLRIATPIYPHTYTKEIPLKYTSKGVGSVGVGAPIGIVVINIESKYLFQILSGYNSKYRGHMWMYFKNGKETINENTGDLGWTNFLFCTSGMPESTHHEHIKFLMEENKNREGITNKGGVFFAVSKIKFISHEWFIVSESNLSEILNEPNEIMDKFLKGGLFTSCLMAILIGSLMFFNLKRRNAERMLSFEKLMHDKLKSVNMELNSANERLKELDRLKTDFLNIVTHDLSTPLTSIKAYTAMLIKYKNKPDTFHRYDEFLNVISKETTRLERLINDYLDIAKMEAGQITFRQEPVNLKSIISETLFTYQGEAMEKGITIQPNFINDIPVITADDGKIRQVVSNLVSNAVKYTPEGGTVNVSAAKKNNHIEVSVQDTGQGIPKEYQEKIFERFVQVEDGSKRAKKGTGLGLPIVKNIVEKHGGRVWVESEEGKGAKFIFTLPI